MHSDAEKCMSGPSQLMNSTLEMVGSPVLTRVLPAVYLLVFLFSTPCNLLSLWLFCRHTERKNPMVIFSINLSLADLLYSISLPFQIFYHFQGNNWPFGSVMCSVVTTAFFVNMHCSILTTCVISLERYCGIVHPLRTRHWLTPRKSTLICLLIWACVLSVYLPVYHKNLLFKVNQFNVTTCFDILPKCLFPNSTLAYLYFCAVLFLFTVLPLFVLIGCYSTIIRKLYRSRKLDTPQQVKRQTIRLIAVVVLCFVTCYLPNIVVQIFHTIYTSKGMSLYVYYKLSLGINSFNCCFDPFIYYFASKEFRQKVCAKISCITDEQENSVMSVQQNALSGISDRTAALLGK
ncbi:hypothetical protein GJAV_G00212650 [Gymnothorax javanicus]|nr:hypothetical protein GJAV_G00212650 [Gymnothorax javanicus]